MFCGAWKVPSPLPSSTETRSAKGWAAARSWIPSPLKSPTDTHWTAVPRLICPPLTKDMVWARAEPANPVVRTEIAAIRSEGHAEFLAMLYSLVHSYDIGRARHPERAPCARRVNPFGAPRLRTCT